MKSTNLAILTLLLMAAEVASSRPATKSAAKVDPYASLYAEAQAAAADQLRDPFSAKFRNLRRMRSDFQQGWKVCGEVDAKNAFGAYVGFKVFAYIPASKTAVLEAVEDRPAFSLEDPAKALAGCYHS